MKTKEQAINFLREIKKLCSEHGFQICAGDSYSIDIWELTDGEDQIHASSVRFRLESENNYQEIY